MRIGSTILAGTALALGLTSPAVAGEARAAWTVRGESFPGVRSMHGVVEPGTTIRRWGPQFRGRWFAGWYAPGGWAAYRRPPVGSVLPSYWVNPNYRIGNYGAYDLPAPAPGFGWSRYYDDAVMIDRDGRVRDHRDGMDWGRDGGPPPPMGYDDDVTAPAGPQRHEDGGRAEGDGRDHYGIDYDAPPYDAPTYDAPPAVVHHDGPDRPIVTTTQTPGYYAGGYYYPGTTTTTVVVQPAVTTTRTYVIERMKRPRRHK